MTLVTKGLIRFWRCYWHHVSLHFRTLRYTFKTHRKPVDYNYFN